MKDTLDHVDFIPLFKGLSKEHYTDLARIIEDRLYKRDQLIFSEGDEGTGFFVVISGRVKFFKVSLEGKEQILHFFGPGDPFGEVPVFAGEHFPANAEAVEPSRIFYFPRAAFVDMISKNPSIALNMLSILSRRLRIFANMIDSLSLKEVPGRLAAYILYFSRSQNDLDEILLDISKGQLASLLGTIPETLSRVFTRMTRERIIESDGHNHIRIIDRNALEELAEGLRRLS